MGDLPASVGDGDERGVRFESLYRQHFSPVYAYFVRRVAVADVGDLVADVFTVAWRRIAEVPAPPDDRLWIYGVAHRVAAQHLRGRRRRDRLVARLRAHERRSAASAAEDLAAARVAELLSRLKREDQELVRLIVWERLAYAEVGTVLGCSANAVAIRWHRALKRLRRGIDVPSEAPLTVLGEE